MGPLANSFLNFARWVNVCEHRRFVNSFSHCQHQSTRRIFRLWISYFKMLATLLFLGARETTLIGVVVRFMLWRRGQKSFLDWQCRSKMLSFCLYALPQRCSMTKHWPRCAMTSPKLLTLSSGLLVLRYKPFVMISPFFMLAAPTPHTCRATLRRRHAVLLYKIDYVCFIV